MATENDAAEPQETEQTGATALEEGESGMATFDGNAYCDFEGQVSSAVEGKNVLLCIFDATGAKLLAIAGQKSFSMNSSTETKEVTSKDDKHKWVRNLPGKKSWTMSVDGLMVKDDESQKELTKAYVGSSYVCLKVVEEAQGDAVTYKDVYGGLALITTFSAEAPEDDSMTYTAEFTGTGKLWFAAAESAIEGSAAPANRI